MRAVVVFVQAAIFVAVCVARFTSADDDKSVLQRPTETEMRKEFPAGNTWRTVQRMAQSTRQLHELGQSLWLDNITRELLDSGTLNSYIHELSITGLTSNPTIFDNALKKSELYDAQIHRCATSGGSAEDLFYELALDDLTKAADLFQPIHAATDGIDGWVSLEVSPELADDACGSIAAAAQLHERAARPNLFIKIPGTHAGVKAIEESIFAGVPINVTLLFSMEQYVAAADAYVRGIERRIAAGRDPRVGSVASIFVSRWDVAVHDEVPASLRNRLGIAMAQRIYKVYCERLTSARWTKLEAAGARAQRLLWASTGTKDPEAPDTMYVEALAAPNTINTMPEKTLHAFEQHGRVKGAMERDGGDAEEVLAAFAAEGVSEFELAADLQRQGTQSFDKSWKQLLARIADKSAALQGRPRRLSLGQK